MSNKHLSILVIEDNDGDFVLIEDYLIESFKSVQINRHETFSSFIKFKENEAEVNYDLILLDLHLPDLSGIELIERLLSFNVQVPIIILTGYTDLSLAKESLKLGIDDFLIKDEVSSSILHKSIEFAFSRSQYIMHIEAQNEKLRKIAWTQSHVVRAPLARILGFINLIEIQKDNLDDVMFCLKQLRVSCDEMDTIVRKIIEEAQGIQLNKNNV